MQKTQSHGHIGEAAVAAKCWMNGIAAYSTGGLRANFAGSDLLIDTKDPKVKYLVEVKTGYTPTKGTVYLTQCGGDRDLETDKFVADYVVFVNMDSKVGRSHQHDGTLGFEHLSFYVMSRDAANATYRAAVKRLHAIPKLDGGQRKLKGMAVTVPEEDMAEFRDAWHVIHGAS